MKKPKVIALIISFFLLGLFIGKALEQKRLDEFFTSNQQAIDELERPVHIVVAQRDLNAGDVIDASSVAARGIPNQYISSYHVLATEYKEILEGHRLIRSLEKGDPILLEFVE